MDFAAVAELCAPHVAPDTLKRIAAVESSFNPWAIGVVGAHLVRQPRTRAEALATAKMLSASGYDFSIGLVQVNQKNFGRFGMSAEDVFDPCTNLRLGGQILEDCYKRAGGSVRQMGDALSCYYSGNFTTGYSQGYVARVSAAAVGQNAGEAVQPIPVVSLKHVRSGSKQRAAVAPSQLFVSAPPAPTTAADPANSSPTPKATQTALLF